MKELVAPWRRRGRNVTVDKFFISIPLAADLLNDGFSYVGTIRSTKPTLPYAMKSSNNREVHSSLFGFKYQVTLFSYVPKQNKSVLAMSTMHHDASVAGEVHTPEIILHYKATKSTVDNRDHLVTMFTARRKVNR